MESASPKIEVRKATIADYEAVLDINRNCHGGADYIPYGYHSFITDPGYCYYLCLVDGEVATLQGVCYLDDRKTLMARSERVKGKFQGQGLLAHTWRKIIEDHKHLPGEKRIRRCCDNNLPYINSKTFRSLHKTLLVQRITHFKDFFPTELPIVDRDFGQAKGISYDQFGLLIQNEAVTKYLYPENFITSSFWFYDVLKSNVQHIQKVTQRIFVTSPLFRYLPVVDGSTESSNSSSHWDLQGRNQDDVKTGLLTMFNYYITTSHLFVALTVAGQPQDGSGAEELASMLVHTFDYIKALYSTLADKVKDKPLFFLIYTSQDLPEKIVLEAGRFFGLRASESDSRFTAMYCFEQDFDYLSKFKTVDKASGSHV